VIPGPLLLAAAATATGPPPAEAWSAIVISLRVAAVAATAALPFGIAVAWVLARRRFPGRLALEAVVHAPLVLPPVVTGYLLLLLLGREGPIGALLERLFGAGIVFTWWAAVIAAAVVSFPLMVRAIRQSIEAVDPRLEDAARTLGAGPWRTFALVTLPLSRPGLLTGWLLAFARGLGEFGATIMIAGNIPGQTRTIPLAIWSMTQRPDGVREAWGLVAASVVIALVAVAAGEWLARRDPGRREVAR
jgi:molybdate transport system permease protein